MLTFLRYGRFEDVYADLIQNVSLIVRYAHLPFLISQEESGMVLHQLPHVLRELNPDRPMIGTMDAGYVGYLRRRMTLDVESRHRTEWSIIGEASPSSGLRRLY